MIVYRYDIIFVRIQMIIFWVRLEVDKYFIFSKNRCTFASVLPTLRIIFRQMVKAKVSNNEHSSIGFGRCR